MADPVKTIEELRQAADGLKQAAADLRKLSGGKPIGQSLIDAAKNFIRPSPDLRKNDLLDEAFGVAPKPPREDKPAAPAPAAPPQPGDSKDSFKRDQHEMVRELVNGRPEKSRKEPATSDEQPTPNKLHETVTRIGNAVGNRLGRTRIGRAIPPRVKAGIARGFGRTAAKITGAGKGVPKSPKGVGGVSPSGGLAGKVGGFAAIITMAITALVSLYKSLIASADQQREIMFKYAEVSAGMAVIKGQAEFQDTLRDMQRGERLAPSARLLSNADQKLKDNSTELIVLVDSLKNGVLGFLENGLANILEPLNEMAKGVNKWLKDNGFLTGDDDADFLALDQFVERVKRDGDAALKRGDQWHQAARADRR